jgi:hypothetical protein
MTIEFLVISILSGIAGFLAARAERDSRLAGFAATVLLLGLAAYFVWRVYTLLVGVTRL